MNGRTEREYLDEDAVTITRPSKWGNPYILGKDGDRATVIACYRAWLWDRIKSGEVSLEELADLHGRQLVCICKPKPCHGDVLEAAAEWAVKQLETRGDAIWSNVIKKGAVFLPALLTVFTLAVAATVSTVVHDAMVQAQVRAVALLATV